jgi:hypothetical protein
MKEPGQHFKCKAESSVIYIVIELQSPPTEFAWVKCMHNLC